MGQETSCTISQNISAEPSGPKAGVGSSVTVKPGVPLVKLIIVGEGATDNGRQKKPLCINCMNTVNWPAAQLILPSALGFIQGKGHAVSSKFEIITSKHGG